MYYKGQYEIINLKIEEIDLASKQYRNAGTFLKRQYMSLWTNISQCLPQKIIMSHG